MRVADMLLQKHDLVEISFRAERHHTKYAIDKHWISLLTSAVARPEGEERRGEDGYECKYETWAQ